MLGRFAGLLIRGTAAMIIIVWTEYPPSIEFEGTRTERYTKALAYYREKMGIDYKLHVYPVSHHDSACAWVERVGSAFPFVKDVRVGISDDPQCHSFRPEYMALHECCHLRMKHLESPILETMSNEEKHDEVRKCILWYGRYR